MTRLLFTVDGQLREQERVLARFARAEDTAAIRLLVDAGDGHEIVPLGPSGWGFELRDARGRCSGGFQPFRLRRGGRLRVGEVGLALHGQPWSHDEWLLSAYDGRRLAATVMTPAGDSRADVAVALEVGEPLEALGQLVGGFALGCWLIARWRRTPAADHLLCTAASGADITAQRASGAGVGA